MDRKASVEVPEDDKPDVITPLRKNRVALDSYIVPVVFEKPSPIRKASSGERGEEGRISEVLLFGFSSTSWVIFLQVGRSIPVLYQRHLDLTFKLLLR
jgi:hypothetical protein